MAAMDTPDPSVQRAEWRLVFANLAVTMSGVCAMAAPGHFYLIVWSVLMAVTNAPLYRWITEPEREPAKDDHDKPLPPPPNHTGTT